MSVDMHSRWGFPQFGGWLLEDRAHESDLPKQRSQEPTAYTKGHAAYFEDGEGRDEFDRHAIFKAQRMHKLSGTNSLLTGNSGVAAQGAGVGPSGGAVLEIVDNTDSRGDEPERCHSPDLPEAAAVPVGVPDAPQAVAVRMEVISTACLHALLGSTAVLPQLLNGSVRLSFVRPLALNQLAKPICEAGLQRAHLEGFVQHHGSPELHACVDATQQAFVQAVAAVLDHHARTLTHILGSIELRREAESRSDDPVDTPAVSIPPTPLEILQHTRQLRMQLNTLARLCWCQHSGDGGSLSWQTKPYPRGNALLEHLYAGASRHDAKAWQSIVAHAC
jgi:hypothetical protein